MKKRIAIVLVLLMILSIFPVAVFAEEDQLPVMINVTVHFVDAATDQEFLEPEVYSVDGNELTYVINLVKGKEELKNWSCVNSYAWIYDQHSDVDVVLYFDEVVTAEFKFQDESGYELKSPEFVRTGLGELVDVSSKTSIKGYTLQNTEAVKIPNINKSYVGDEAVILVYKMNADAVFDITVHFVDEFGNTLNDDLKTQVKGGEAFNEVFEIEGYEGEYELNLEKVREDVETTFIFSKAVYNVTIAYVDKDGNTLAPSKDVNVEHGQDITVDNPVIEGYKTDSAKVELKNVTSNDYIEIVYTKVDNGGEDDPVSPETGDNSSFVLMLGFMLVSCAGIIGFRKKILG